MEEHTSPLQRSTIAIEVEQPFDRRSHGKWKDRSGPTFGICGTYDGATFASFTGDADYLGPPTLYWHIKHHMLMSAAWETKVAGNEVGPMSANLDLTDFSCNRGPAVV